MYGRPLVQFRIFETGRRCGRHLCRRECEYEEGPANVYHIAFLKQGLANRHTVHKRAVGAIEIGYPAFSLAVHDDGIELTINSGWRSAQYQDQLLLDAVSQYGSEREAARWVATADTSPHVSGDAVDIGSADAIAWLAHHGARYGLCQSYRNESWHYELRSQAIDGRCPRMYADPTHDPRMQP